jgi:hypothetical protein
MWPSGYGASFRPSPEIHIYWFERAWVRIPSLSAFLFAFYWCWLRRFFFPRVACNEYAALFPVSARYGLNVYARIKAMSSCSGIVLFYLFLGLYFLLFGSLDIYFRMRYIMHEEK